MTATFTYTAASAFHAPPVAPDEDWYPPSFDDPTGVHRVQVAVLQIRPKRWLGELLQAVVHDGRSENIDGGGECTVAVPVDDISLGILTSDEETWGTLTTGRLDLINVAFACVEDGVITGYYMPRGPGRVKDGMVVFSCLAPGEALFPTRTLGRVPYDFLNGNGTFPPGVDFDELPGFEWTGDPDDLMFVTGPRDTRALAIRGDAFSNDPALLRVHVWMSTDEVTTFNNIVRASAFMRLPTTAEEGSLLMTMETFTVGDLQRTWPHPDESFPDDMIAVVDESRMTGDWETDPVTAANVMPKGPYNCLVRCTIYPDGPLEWTSIDGLRIFRRDSLGTEVTRDLVDHLALLARDAQAEPAKSTWNLPVVRGASCGISEVGVWRREDFQPLTDAFDAICSRDGGPARPWVDRQWRIRVQAVRGVDRTGTVTIGPDQVLDHDGWVHDPGAQVSQVIAQTDMGSDYWRHLSISTDTTRTSGHLVERVTRAPNGMGLRPLDQWTNKDLAARSQPQETVTIWVSMETGWLHGPGDRFRLVLLAGLVRFDRDVQVISRAFHDQRRMVALTVGVDEAA